MWAKTRVGKRASYMISPEFMNEEKSNFKPTTKMLKISYYLGSYYIVLSMGSSTIID